eukprot:gene15278-biopygen15719
MKNGYVGRVPDASSAVFPRTQHSPHLQVVKSTSCPFTDADLDAGASLGEGGQHSSRGVCKSSTAGGWAHSSGGCPGGGHAVKAQEWMRAGTRCVQRQNAVPPSPPPIHKLQQWQRRRPAPRPCLLPALKPPSCRAAAHHNCGPPRSHHQAARRLMKAAAWP